MDFEGRIYELEAEIARIESVLEKLWLALEAQGINPQTVIGATPNQR